MDDIAAARERRIARLETSDELMHKQEFSVAEVAELFRISERVIRDAVYRHELPAVMAGHSIVAIPRAGLLAWLQRRGGV